MTATIASSGVSAEDRVALIAKSARGLILKHGGLTGKTKSSLRAMVDAYRDWRLKEGRSHNEARDLVLEGFSYCEGTKKCFEEIIGQARARALHPAMSPKLG